MSPAEQTGSADATDDVTADAPVDATVDDDVWVEPLAHLIEEIGVLTTRWRGRRGQPVVSLVGDGARSALATLFAGLTVSRVRQVPHALIDGKAPGSVRALLAQAAEELVSGPFGRGHRLRFRHFWFLDWLMDQRVPKGPARERRAELARRLRRASGPRSELPRIGSGVLAGWSGLVLLTVSTLVPAVIFRVLVSGRVPGPGRVFRWLMRRRYASLGAADFWSFALRLTADANDQRDPALMNRLLVHAFLQDLTDQYRRVPWRRMPWRRTAYPVLLLDDVAADGPGAELVRLLSVVRGKSEVVDPLLVVTAEDVAPPADAIPLTMADEALRQWRTMSRIARGAGRCVVKVPGATRLAELPMVLPHVVPRQPPWFTHWGALVAIPLLPVVAAGVWIFQGSRAGCVPVHLAGQVDVAQEFGQCVGYSDHQDQVFGDDGLRAVQRLIFAQNREAEDARRLKPDQPHVAVVYLGTLTKPGAQADDETFAAEREELEGLAVAQHQANQRARDDQNAPLLRVVIANAGQEMQAVDTVAAMLRELLERDKSVIGIVGLVESRTWTKDALDLLDQEGLPIIAPTLSADDIGAGLSYYLQISPPNREQATMVRDYATGVLGRGELFNYYTYGAGGKQSADTDLYVNTLRDSLEKAYAERPGASYRERYWGGGELDEVCGARRQYPGVVFFGGRYHDFGAFLNQLARDCSGKLPIVIGDDSVNRYMANTSARAAAPDVLPLSYVSKGALAFCERLEAARADQDTERAAFLNAVREVLGRCVGDAGEPVGERVGLTYDGVNLLLSGVRNMASRRPNSGIGRTWVPTDITPGALYQEIRDRVAADGYLGVTGRITFDGDGVVVDKPLSLLCVRNVRLAFEDRDNLPSEVYRVGRDLDTTPPARAVECR